jgi:hypothetical protein
MLPEAPMEPTDPDLQLHAAWLTRLSESGEAVSMQLPAHDGCSAPEHSLNIAGQFDVQELVLPPVSRRGMRANAIIAALVGCACAMVIAVVSVVFEDLQQSPGEQMYIEPSNTSWAAPIADDPEAPKLSVEPSLGVVGKPAWLGLSLQRAPDYAVVMIKGLLPTMELSAGRSVGNSAWQIPVTDLKDVWVAPPPGFVGFADLVAELYLPNFQIVDRQSFRMEWTPPSSASERARESEHAREQDLTDEKDRAPLTKPPPAIQHLNAPDRFAVTPVPRPKPSQHQLRRYGEKSDDAGTGGQKNLRRSVERTRLGSPAVAPNDGSLKGFWDWSR